jgi:hypothetical protein
MKAIIIVIIFGQKYDEQHTLSKMDL